MGDDIIFRVWGVGGAALGWPGCGGRVALSRCWRWGSTRAAMGDDIILYGLVLMGTIEKTEKIVR